MGVDNEMEVATANHRSVYKIDGTQLRLTAAGSQVIVCVSAYSVIGKIGSPSAYTTPASSVVVSRASPGPARPRRSNTKATARTIDARVADRPLYRGKQGVD